jgi:hypothetical protein
VNAYAPRRQGKRWLDGDCPRGVLAVYYDKREPSDKYTIFYAEPVVSDGTYAGTHIQYAGLSEYGMGYHGELPAYQAAQFRFRNAHRARKWSELPEAVRNWVISDLNFHPEEEHS